MHDIIAQVLIVAGAVLIGASGCTTVLILWILWKSRKEGE